MLVVELDRGVLAVPGQRRRDQHLAVTAEIAPVVLADAVADEAIGKALVADRTGNVEQAVSAGFRGAEGRAEQRDRAVLVELRPLADGVDDAAGIHDAVEQRGRPLQHLDAFDRGIEAAALHQRHAVAHDRAVAVVAEAAADHRVLAAGERVGLGDAGDVDERIVDVARELVLQHLRGHDVDGLRGIERRGAAAQRGRARHRAVAELGSLLRGGFRCGTFRYRRCCGCGGIAAALARGGLRPALGRFRCARRFRPRRRRFHRHRRQCGLRLRGRRARGKFDEQHGCADEKTCAALAGRMSTAADALAIQMGTHFHSLPSQTQKLARLTVGGSEENRRRA